MVGSGSSILTKIRFYFVVALFYVGTGSLLWYVLHPAPKPLQIAQAESVADGIALSERLAGIKKRVNVGKPVRVVVPSLGIDLPVEEGIYNETDQTWTLSGNRAHYAEVSFPINNVYGNTLIYGHNNKHVFGPLKRINPGDTVHIHTSAGHVFTYTFTSFQEVAPEDTSILRYQGPPLLTLQTCSGNWNERRKLFQFNLSTVESPGDNV